MACTLAEEARRLARVLSDESRAPSIVTSPDGSIRINGAGFDQGDILEIMRGALGHRFGMPPREGAVPLDGEPRQVVVLRTLEDLRHYRFSIEQIQAVGTLLARQWERHWEVPTSEWERAPAIEIRCTGEGLGEFKVPLALCREVTERRQAHGGLTIYEPTPDDLRDCAMRDYGAALTPAEAQSLFDRIDGERLVDAMWELGCAWERQVAQARRTIGQYLMARDMEPYTDQGRLSRPLGRDEVEQALLADYGLCCGRIVLASRVEGVDATGNPASIECDPPAVLRIAAGGLGWMDENRCNTAYDVELMEPHPALAGMTPARIHGTSRSTDGSVLHAAFTVAPADFQLRYAAAQAAGEPDAEVPAQAVGV